MSNPTNQPTLFDALEDHKAGRIAAAEATYRRILHDQPDQPDALHLLGALLHQKNEFDEAERLIRRAIALRPRQAIFHGNLALVLVSRERWEEAIDAAQASLACDGQYFPARFHLARALVGANRLAEAIAAFRQVVAQRPDHADAQFHLGRALCLTGPPAAAIAECRRAVELRPDRVEGYSNLGVAYTAAGLHFEAARTHRQALRIKPDYALAWHQLAGALWLTSQLDEAEEACRRAIALNPADADSCATLANILKDQGRIHDCIGAYRRSVALKPQAYPQYGSLLYALHYDPDYDSRAIFHEHCLWEAVQARPIENAVAPHGNDRSPDRRLRIGYVSPHFRNQATSFFTYPLLAAHDHAQFEIYCYADVMRADDITEKLKLLADIWRLVRGQTDEQIAQLIRRDQIDILVDLTMHMAEGRPMLFARKPAPVQVAWLAYPGTTGLATMDYRLTDPYLDPPGLNDAFYSEKCFRLPETVLCYDPLATTPKVNPLPALSNGHVTFGSLNHFSKANDRVLEMWAATLAAVPGSRMLVLAGQGSHRRRLENGAAALGVDPRRIEYLDRQPREQYLEYCHKIDIFLDTWPYNGETTSLDGLWMGVPMVTLCGQTASSRAGLCYLTHLGLTDLVALTPGDYPQIAARLAGDLPRLAKLRSELRERMQGSPLMDGPRFAMHVEKAYREMWHNWCKAT